MSARTLVDGRTCRIWTGDLDGSTRLVHENSEILLEAPNWSLDGARLLLNGDGLLFGLDLGSGRLGQIEIDDLPPINNDHLLDPDGERIWMSAGDGRIHRAPLAGGRAEQITEDDGCWHFLHGISPDGRQLAYIEIDAAFSMPGAVVVLDLASGERLRPDPLGAHWDGAEFGPDGQWLYANSEAFTEAPGHAQLVRMRPDGADLERLVTSDTVDWFPHLSPDGRWASYLTFPPGTQGHPADHEVEVRVVATADWTQPVLAHPVFGGQGTLNVNSWAPDSTALAWVSY